MNRPAITEVLEPEHGEAKGSTQQSIKSGLATSGSSGKQLEGGKSMPKNDRKQNFTVGAAKAMSGEWEVHDVDGPRVIDRRSSKSSTALDLPRTAGGNIDLIPVTSYKGTTEIFLTIAIGSFTERDSIRVVSAKNGNEP